ncbi:MAG: SRPBCC family protein, partial [Candidatus Eiseniibacteriota bacterium]
EKTSDTEFTAKVRAKVGPVSASFTGAVKLSDLDPPNGYTISGEGKGGAAGFAKGGAKVQLKDDGAGTLLAYQVDAQVGGKLAQIGSRLIDGTARKLSEEFFSKFASIVGGEPAPGAAPAAETAAAAPATSAASAAPARGPAPAAPQRKGLPSWLWVAALVVVVIILLAIFAR